MPEFTHGVNGYNRHACRCVICRQANTDRVADARDRRLRRALANPELIPHGTEGGYTNWGCRCDPCTAVATAGQADRRVIRGRH